MKIYITACAKSGTTLLARLMASFGLPVHGSEISLYDFCKKRGAMIGKRSEHTIFSNILNKKDIEKQIELIKNNDIKIINMYRNGSDVLESFMNDWGYWNPLIWCTAIEHIKEYSDLISASVCYEQLIYEPDTVQQSLAEHFKIDPLWKFSDYPNDIPEHLFPTDVERYKPRPISAESIGKKFNVKRKGMDLEYFNEQMKYLGYEEVR